MRVRANFFEGVLDASVSDTGTELSSPGFEALPEISGDDYLVLVVGNEIVDVTAHTASADTVTVERAKEGTTAVAHDEGEPWHHGPTHMDYPQMMTQAEYDAITPREGVLYVIVEEEE